MLRSQNIMYHANYTHKIVSIQISQGDGGGLLANRARACACALVGWGCSQQACASTLTCQGSYGGGPVGPRPHIAAEAAANQPVLPTEEAEAEGLDYRQGSRRRRSWWTLSPSLRI